MAETGTVEQLQLDFNTLVKGQAIRAGRLAEMCGFPIGSKDFVLFRLSLRNEIHKRCGFTAVNRGDDLIILTDAEALEYNPKNFRGHIRGARRAFQRLNNIDVRNFDDQQKLKIVREAISQSRVLQSINRARRQTIIVTGRPETSRAREIPTAINPAVVTVSA
jgi:hypothetical protein